MSVMLSLKETYKVILYAIGIALDASGVFVAIAFPEYGPQLGGVALVLVGVYVMRFAKRLGTVEARGMGDVNKNDAESREIKWYTWVLSIIALVIIFGSIIVGVLGALRNISRMLSTSYVGFAIGIMLFVIVVGRSRMFADKNLHLTKPITSNKYRRIATVVETSSVVVCVLAFLAWHQNVFHAVNMGWPIYLTVVCLVLFLIASGYKIYLSVRNIWPR